MQNRRRFLSWGVLCIAMAVGMPSVMAQAVPAKPAPWRDAPAGYRSFIEKAKQAEAIKDPLQRCLAYPDYPDNQWPAGLAAAHCHLVFDPAITLDDVRGYLDRDAITELDARFKADLDRHFSKDRFSEVIHRDFEGFDDSVASGQLSMRWVEMAPASPYALTARGQYFLAMASKARGGKWAADTPSENMQRMSEFLDKAIENYRKALELEPRLLQADAGIASAAGFESRRDDVQNAAFAHGMSVDPACKVLTATMMVNLEPRWGGSYAAMNTLAVQLSAYVPQRPLLALNTIWPQVDAADMASKTDSYNAAASMLRSVLINSTNSLAFDKMGRWLDYTTSVDRWEQLVILLEASRFGQGTQEANRIRGRLLVNLAWEPKWAIDSLKAAVAQDPGDAYAHYLLGAAYWNSGAPAQAEADYLAAMKDAGTRRAALHELTRAMLSAHKLTKARKYVDLLNKEYPKFAPGWMTRGSVLLGQGINGEEVTQALRKFEATADPNDFRQMQELQHVRAMLKTIDKTSEASSE
ncbi:DUF4034 domain-containing protein [Rhodanobacter sp. KK11]|uniref:DUF4034 domain-containing protein n=1 Tax=Rhodanobacter sp. KK11 TaxID=3083255 RepID=UPI0029664286|nr:DUF4034 domain-containing protein [Rhodanobacter sp. KK11]MDW2982318.1 DUF4034 domain-containing protein [Rhodanobacter sp. KK11]